MKTNRPKLRRAIRALLLLIACAVILILLLPLWFPLALRPILKHESLRYASFHRIGYTRFAITSVQGKWNQTTFSAKQIECELPTIWLAQNIFHEKLHTPQLIVRDGILRVNKSTNEVASAGQSSSSKTLDTIQRIGITLNRIFASASLTNCVIETGAENFSISQARLENGTLRADVRASKFSGAIQITATIAAREMDLSVFAPRQNFELAGNFSREESGWKLIGDATWLTNRAALWAQFDTNSWWPDRARLDAPDIRVPSKFIGVKGYEDLRGALALDLVSNQFSLQATGFALPIAAPKTENFPKVQASLRARGDPNSITLTQFEIQAPWMRAQLNNEIGITREGKFLGSGARLQLAANLDAFPGGAFLGRANGLVIVEPQTTRRARARFELTGADIRAFGFHLVTNSVSGDFDWPVLNVRDASLQLADGSEFRAAGSLDVIAKKIAECNWRFSGKLSSSADLKTNRIQRTEPELRVPLRFEKIEASGELHGAVTNITHSGSATFENLTYTKFKLPRAQINWHGENFDLDSAKVEAAAGEATLSVAGSLDLREIARHKISGAIQNASLHQTNKTVLALEQPFAFIFFAAQKKQTGWKLSVGQSRWTGNEKNIVLFADVNWPERGEVRVAATNLSPRDFSILGKTGFENVMLAELNANAHWSNGPVHSKIEFAAASDDPIGGHVTATGTATLGETLVITNLSVASSFAPPLVASGELAIQIFPARTNWLAADDQRALNFQADWQAGDQEFLLPLGPWGKLQISKPRMQARASGTLALPTARLVMTATSIDWQGETNIPARPRLDDLDVNFELARDSMALRRFAANIDGQPIRAWAESPLAPDSWEKLFAERKPPDWKQARGQLEIEQANVSALSRYAPAVLAPEGRVSLNVSLEPGGKFDGLLLLTNAATRPLGEFTPLRNIAVRVKLSGEEAVLENFQGEIGGEPVRATGRVKVSLQGPLDYEVNLQGTNVPLARSVEFLLRGDMNVQLRGGRTNQSVLTGAITLHDGLYLQHTSSLLTGSRKRPELRPPYFSVTNAPFADWRLNLAIHGNQFLRVRTPFFSGTVSANLAVRGALRDPIVTGDAHVDSGRILFPFGTLNVEQGFASLTGADPRGPDILLNASGRNFDYDVRLEVHGPADGADVVFSSTPPLNSDEILLMLTAGELPQNTYTFSAAARAGRLATFLGRDIFSRFSGDNGEERLIITTGENISEEGKLTYSVEYRFTPRWSVVGEYDRFGAVNAEVKWKLFAR
jgi:translocation and assembly module TamB